MATSETRHVATISGMMADRRRWNKLFVALTRTKGWLRIFGVRSRTFAALEAEVAKARAKSPQIEFTMPDMTNLNTIQRGLEEKHARIIEAKRRMDRMKDELSLSDDDIASLFTEE